MPRPQRSGENGSEDGKGMTGSYVHEGRRNSNRTQHLEMLRQAVSELRPQELANIAQSCAKLSWRNGVLLGALPSSTQRKIHAPNAKDLASATQRLQATSWADGACLTLVGDASLRIMSGFNPQELGDVCSLDQTKDLISSCAREDSANRAWMYAA
eukprot:s52_g9.t1